MEEVAFYDVFEIRAQRSDRCSIAAPLKVGESTFTAIVDTGAQANVCPLWAISNHDQKSKQRKDVYIRPFGSTPIRPLGVIVTGTYIMAGKDGASGMVNHR